MSSSYNPAWFFPSPKGKEADCANRDIQKARMMKAHHGTEDLLDPAYDDYEMGYKREPLKKGDYCDLGALLFTNSGDNLIRCSEPQDGRHGATAHFLRNKFVLVVAFFIPVVKSDRVAEFCRALIGAYSAFYNQKVDDFEVVMAVRLRPDVASLYSDREASESAAEHFFSAFRWLAVPFSDSDRCTQVCENLGLLNYHSPESVLVNKAGMILQQGLPFFLFHFGTDLYPFTDEKIELIRQADALAKEEHNLEKLLGCPPDLQLSRFGRDPGRKQSVSCLTSKGTVGLYLCIRGDALDNICKAYLECKADDSNFEIVLVYLGFYESGDWESFRKSIDDELESRKITDWLVFPYCDTVCRRLWRICGTYMDDRMIVVGPGGSDSDLYALNVLSDFGMSSYPFTRKSQMDKVLARLRGVSLQDFLGEVDYVYSGGPSGDKVSVSSLEDQNLIFCLDYVIDKSPLGHQVWIKMLNWFHEIREKDNKFQVVFVCLGEQESASLKEKSGEMPWLYAPYDPSQISKMNNRVLVFNDGEESSLIAWNKRHGICSICADTYDLPNSYHDVFFSGSYLFSEVALRFWSNHTYWLYESEFGKDV